MKQSVGNTANLLPLFSAKGAERPFSIASSITLNPFKLFVFTIYFAGLSQSSIFAGDQPFARGSYLIDSKPMHQTPKYLGVCLEVAESADRSNLWDWLADSGVKMVRVVHPDKDMRVIPASESTYKGIETQRDFDSFRKRLLADPKANIPWSNYCFDKNVPWLGVADIEVAKVIEAGVSPIVSIAYGPHHYPRPLLKAFTGELPTPDESINWAAAASAYEYYLAVIYRHAAQQGVTHFMMLNEPIGDAKYMQQIGVIARMGRLALEDVRGKLGDRKKAAAMRLSGPACHANWEEFWPYVEPYVDFLDGHFYDPDPDMFTRQCARMTMRARQTGKKVAFTEFNRIGGPLQPDQALLAVKPALQLGALTMSVLSAGRAQEPGCEMALLYEFQAPATHRNFKSLVYGDMNLIDWTGQDLALNSAPSEWHPAFDELQIRFATPAYHIFRMLARCTPGDSGNADSYEVLDVGESFMGFNAVHDSAIRHNIYRMLSENKYYALGGSGPDFRHLVVRTPERLLINILNPGPTSAKRVGFDFDLLKESYATAVVRETSLVRRDQAVSQIALSGKRLVVDLSPESLTQIILIKDDLRKVSELKLEERTATPGTIADLGLFQTTRLRALGRIADRWIDLSDLNVVWSSSEDRLVKVYQGGLVQRVRQTGKSVVIAAKTLEGNLQVSQLVRPDEQERKLAHSKSLVANSGFEETVGGSTEPVSDWQYTQQTRWDMGISPAKGWVVKGGASPQWSRSLERNHTGNGKACLQVQVAPGAKLSSTLLAVSGPKAGAELYARNYQISAWVWRPSQGGLAEGVLKALVKFNGASKPLELTMTPLSELPGNQWVEVGQTVTAPVDASCMQFQLSISGEVKQGGALYIDDLAVQEK